MTSLSDSKYDIDHLNEWPARIQGTDVQQVSRLEFQSIDSLSPQMRAEPDTTKNGSERELEGEILRLREELQLQAEQRSLHVKTLQTEELNEAREKWEHELEGRIQAERSKVFETLQKFRGERDRYFVAVEGEVVRLALAIARRILHRESNLDPLLLSGVVRVALEKVADDSTVVLRVPANELEAWQRCNLTGNGRVPRLLGDEQMEPGECILDTAVGRVGLGIATQLQEIERSFFDLLHQRPA